MTVQNTITVDVAEPDVWRNGRFESDGWHRLADDDPIPSDGRVILSARRFVAEATAGTVGNRPLEHSPTKLNDLAEERMLRAIESGAISCRPDDSVRGTSALGVLLEPADKVVELVPYLDLLSVIAIDFPKYNDGRGFSHAAQLARHGFRGEVRAVGNVLIDQITFMKRLGFTSFQVSHGVTRRYLIQNKDPAPKHYYQPSVRSEPPAGTRPWLRRAAD